MRSFFIVLIFFVTIANAQSYQSGRRSVTFTDTDRSNRVVSADLYYPANTPGLNVPLASGTERFPVVVFGHGFVIGTASYSWLADSLVKYGFVVALPSTESSFSPSHSAFGNDIAFLCKRITSLRDSSASFLFQRVTDKSAAGGHSMGGGASFLAMNYNANIQALFNFAAAETNPSAITAAQSMTQPALIFSGSNDCIVAPSVQQSMYNGVSNCKSYINFNGVTHCLFANNNTTCVFGQVSSGCNSSSLTTVVLYQKITAILVPFLNSYLRGSCLTSDYITAFNSVTGASTSRSCSGSQECSVVPVQLLEFNARRKDNGLLLRWLVNEENAIEHYEIQRSKDAQSFESVAQVAAYNVSGERSYSWEDELPYPGKNYYRLKIIDKAAVSRFSNIAGAVMDDFIYIYPNPATTVIFVKGLSANKPGIITVKDATGKQVYSCSILGFNGRVSVDKWPRGIYYVAVKDESGILFKEKIFVQSVQ